MHNSVFLHVYFLLPIKKEEKKTGIVNACYVSSKQR